MTGCSSKENVQTKDKVKNDALILEDQVVDGLTIKDFSIVKDKEHNLSSIYFEVVNETEEAKNVNEVTFTMSDGSSKNSLTSSLNGPIKPGEARIITEEVDVDLTKITKVEYEIK